MIANSNWGLQSTWSQVVICYDSC